MQRIISRTSVLLAMLVLPLPVFAAGGQSPSSTSQQQAAEVQEQKAEIQLQAAEAKKDAILAKQEVSQADRVKLERQLREAQAKLQVLAQRVAQLSLQLSGPEVDSGREFHIYKHLRRFNDNQAVLGVTIFDSGHEKSSTNGVKVVAVTPGGPAQKAGLRAGDVITAINGKAFRTDKPGSADSKLLEFMARAPYFQPFYDALPVAGVDGTLAGQFHHTALQGHIHAKTGSMEHVNALSGYMNLADRHRLAFVIIGNHQPLHWSQATKVIDRIAREIYRQYAYGR